MMYKEPKRPTVKFWWIFFGWNAFAITAFSYWNLRQRGKDPDYDKLSHTEKYMKAIGYTDHSNVSHIQLKGLQLKSIRDKRLSEAIHDRTSNESSSKD